MLHLPKCLFLLTASAQVQVEPVGRWFEAYIRRRTEMCRTPKSLELHNVVERYCHVTQHTLCTCQNQDHYATQKQIKAARDIQIDWLKHHPDKRKAAGSRSWESNDYFTCITKGSSAATIVNTDIVSGIC
uniref:Secreted protein n=1 Tax=Maylandia zebra TaxID=106582 RepID=A0A3P9DU24_9CICH